MQKAGTKQVMFAEDAHVLLGAWTLIDGEPPSDGELPIIVDPFINGRRTLIMHGRADHGPICALLAQCCCSLS